MRAMVVEDEPLIAGLLVRLLERRGIDAVVARSRAEALTLLALDSRSYDLAYVDVCLSDGRGLDVLVEMRRRGADIPTILATGQVEDLQAEARVVLRKPFQIAAFDAAVDACAKCAPAEAVP
jgi:two-component system OmpR family response regulator